MTKCELCAQGFYSSSAGSSFCEKCPFVIQTEVHPFTHAYVHQKTMGGLGNLKNADLVLSAKEANAVSTVPFLTSFQDFGNTRNFWTKLKVTDFNFWR
jgi:hypothetical protein